MFQNKQYVKFRLAAYAIIAMLGCSFTVAVNAVDDDYYIPYTDTYGYSYDPQTGTYVKQDSPAADTANTGQTSMTDTPANTSIQTTGGTSDSTQSEVPAESDSASRPIGMNVVLPGLLLLAGVAGYLLISRRKKLQV